MGKPYASELARLSGTYIWALSADVDALTEALGKAASYPLVAVGSGGSLTAAMFCATLHERVTGQPAQSCTPLEYVSSPPFARSKSAVILFSAGGSNPDIIAAARSAMLSEPPLFIVLTAREGTPIANAVKDCAFAVPVELRVPTNGDGFLATNSLLASVLVVYRAYRNIVPLDQPLPTTVEGLVGEDPEKRMAALTSHLWPRTTLVVLHGLLTKPAALDLESKFTEAALGNVQVSDFRNFAHGRHYWLAKQGVNTAVLALIARQDEKLAQATLRLLPQSIPVARVAVPQDGMLSSLAALVLALHIVGVAGRTRGLDPGRPGVPLFGRRLYGLRTLSTLNLGLGDGPRRIRECAIFRKADAPASQLIVPGHLKAWEDAYDAFIGALTSTTYAGLVLDYDGTLVEEGDRFTGPNEAIVKHLLRLLKGGVPIAIASGRGKSVREQLRESVPRKFWEAVLIGYYNGSEIARLNDEAVPAGTVHPCPELVVIADAIRTDTMISRAAHVSVRHRQISVRPKTPVSTTHLWQWVMELAIKRGTSRVQVVQSGHSIDVIPIDVTKLSVVKRLRADTGLSTDAPILSIGDRGRWPGNDALLLSEPWTLSVNEVSPDPATCWNLAPPGYRGTFATRRYLGAIQVARESTFKLQLGLLVSSK